MNKFRVDVHYRRDRTPCGMNSIQCLTDNRKEAYKVFQEVPVGVDSWSQPNPQYGVLLSAWNEGKGEYVVLDSRF